MTIVQHDRSSRSFNAIVQTIVLTIALGAGCSKSADSPVVEKQLKAIDPQHAGITTPHGDHTPHHHGMVLMNGDFHYEVVFDPGGKHRLWFSDAVREDLPASLASKVMMVVTRKTGPPESLALAIDDSGESWVAAGQPVTGEDVMVKVSYELRGAPFEIEIPFVASAK